ncbi:MAG TPA: hypothetical protein VK726_14045, partial [Acetobacteraceae bacterium]|nr:hypothetical protein [Acetobacteraceae bacterium]
MTRMEYGVVVAVLLVLIATVFVSQYVVYELLATTEVPKPFEGRSYGRTAFWPGRMRTPGRTCWNGSTA